MNSFNLSPLASGGRKSKRNQQLNHIISGLHCTLLPPYNVSCCCCMKGLLSGKRRAGFFSAKANSRPICPRVSHCVFPPLSLDDSPWGATESLLFMTPLCCAPPSPGSRDPSSKALCGSKYLSRENLFQYPKKKKKKINKRVGRATHGTVLPAPPIKILHTEVPQKS